MLTSRYPLPISSCLTSPKLAHLTINWISPLGCPIKILTSHALNHTSSFLKMVLLLCFLSQLKASSSPEISIISLIPTLPFRHLMNSMTFFILFPCPYTVITVLAQILIIAYLDRCSGFSLPIFLVLQPLLAILCTASKPIY